MFWGITLDAGKRYTQVVEKSFHLSMAALGFQNSSALPVTIMVEVDKANFALCTLQAGKIPQQPLDYAFTEGEEITFYSEGPGEVHLTGYLTEDMEPIEFDDEEVSAASEESTSESAGSQSEEEESSDEEEEFSEDEEITLQDLLHGENEESENSSSQDEWDPSKENPGKKRKMKAENKKIRKKKKTSMKDAVNIGVDLESKTVRSENMIQEKQQERHGLGFFDESLQVDDDDDDDDDEEDKDWSVETEKKKKQLTAKEKRLLKKKAKKKLKQREETVDVNACENAKIHTSENQPSGEKDTVANGVTVNSNGTENDSQSVQAERNTVSPKKSKKPKHSSEELNNSNLVSDNSPKKKSPEKLVQSKSTKQERRIISGGVSVVDVVLGQGKMAKNGQKVSLFYRGILSHNKKQFDACLHGRPFTFVLGKGEVIRGWDLGIAGMKVGGKRKLVIPPSQGYGNRKNGPIPPNSVLEFEVQLIKVV